MKLSANCFELMLEAYRRNEMFQRTEDRHELLKPLGERWIGLGTEPAYRAAFAAGLMRWAPRCGVPAKRCVGWVALTPEGVAQFTEHEAELKAEFQRRKGPRYEASILGNYTLAGGLLT